MLFYRKDFSIRISQWIVRVRIVELLPIEKKNAWHVYNLFELLHGLTHEFLTLHYYTFWVGFLTLYALYRSIITRLANFCWVTHDHLGSSGPLTARQPNTAARPKLHRATRWVEAAGPICLPAVEGSAASRHSLGAGSPGHVVRPRAESGLARSALWQLLPAGLSLQVGQTQRLNGSSFSGEASSRGHRLIYISYYVSSF